jgi:cell division protein FtsZ
MKEFIMNRNQKKIHKPSLTRIKVLGLGGSGCNTISRLSQLDFNEVELIAANTDFKSLPADKADRVIYLGIDTTNGLGSGGDLSIGRKAAEENYKELINCIQNTDVLFLTAGMGGGTGSGAIEIAARIAASLDVITFSIVTLPFMFEGYKRKKIAYEATLNLQPFTDTLITIPNDRLLKIAPSDNPIDSVLGMADDLLIKAIQGLTGILNDQGLMRTDFSHFSQLMKNGGGAYISIGHGQGKNRVISAIDQALNHPLLENTPIVQAKGIIIKLTGDLKIDEVEIAVSYLRKLIDQKVEILPVIEQKDLNDSQVLVSILLTGLGAIPLPDIISCFSEEEPPIEHQSIVSKHKKTDNLERSSNEYEDLIEIPAFLRQGYNFNK